MGNLGNYSMYPPDLDNINRYYYSSSNNNKFEMLVNQENIDASTSYILPMEGIYGRCCGKVVEIDFQEPIEYEEEKNEDKSGLHLITNIAHFFFKGAYKQEVTVIKNAQEKQNFNLEKL